MFCACLSRRRIASRGAKCCRSCCTSWVLGNKPKPVYLTSRQLWEMHSTPWLGVSVEQDCAGVCADQNCITGQKESLPRACA